MDPQRKDRRLIRTIGLMMAYLFVASLAIISCKKTRAYKVDIRDGVRYVHNLEPMYDKPMADLELVRQIGELEPEDDNYMFNFPISAAADEDGNVFVLDSKESCIKKFNAEGRYLTRFGRPGQGPGELDHPMTIDCRNSKLLVTTMASQFHLFDLNGEYIGRFQLPQYQGIDLRQMNGDKFVGFAMIPSGENTKENKVLDIYDIEGNLLCSFGEPYLVETAKSSWVANFLRIVVDDEDNIFVAFSSQNRIEKYSNAGKFLIKIERNLPYNLEYKYQKKKMEVAGKVREYMAEVFPQVSRDIGIDSKGRIWVMALKKQIPRDIAVEDFIYTEFLDLEVYSEEGILLTRIPIPGDMERFDNWSMYNDRLYFVDPFGQSCVYVYKIVWK